MSDDNLSEKELSVVMPAYNEEANIKEMIETCYNFFPSLGFKSFEIIVVDDGSKDKTGTILENLSKENKNLKVFHHPDNRGMGAAVVTGASKAIYDLIFITCSDLQFDIKEFSKFLPLIDEADIVAGVRVNRDYSLYRKINTAVYRFFIKLLFGLKVRDPSWVKLIKKEVFREAPIDSKGFFWDVELLVKAKRKSFSIKEVEVRSQKREGGRAWGANPVRVVKTFLSLLGFWWKTKIKHKTYG